MPPDSQSEALTLLYGATNGSHWHRNDHWLEGEPCANAWYGIVCCPDTHPELQASSAGRDMYNCIAANGSSAVAFDHSRAATRRRQMRHLQAAVRSSLDFPWGCRSGTVTGTRADKSRCLVVGILLNSNNLRGAIPLRALAGEWIATLQVLNLNDNSLTEDFPAQELIALSPSVTMDLSGNEFSMESTQYLQQECRTRGAANGLVCTGFPPESCTAFGPQYVVRTDRPTSCIECNHDRTWAIAVLVGTATLFILAVASYAYFNIKYADFTTQGVGTISIFMTHLQTLYLISSLRLRWPPSSETFFQCAPVLPPLAMLPPSYHLGHAPWPLQPLPATWHMPCLAHTYPDATRGRYMIINGFNLEAARPECTLTRPQAPAVRALSSTRACAACRRPHLRHRFEELSILLLPRSRAGGLSHHYVLDLLVRPLGPPTPRAHESAQLEQGEAR